MNKLRNILDKMLEIICMVLLSFMVILATWQVITRYVLNNPSTVSEDLLIYSFVWMALLAASYVFGKKDHMSMVFFKEKFIGFNNKRKFTISLTSEIMVIIFSALVLVLGGVQISNLAMGQISPALKIPMGYIYLALPISGAITIVYSMLNILDLVKEVSSSNDLVKNN